MGLVRRQPAKRSQPYIVPTDLAVEMLRRIAEEEEQQAADDSVPAREPFPRVFDADFPELVGCNVQDVLATRYGYTPIDAWSHLRPKKQQDHGTGGWRGTAKPGIDYD